MRILVTGANGYIGSHLVPRLLSEGHQVTCVVREPKRFALAELSLANLDIVQADFLDEVSLRTLPRQVDVAFYLVHSMGAVGDDFSALERKSAQNFAAFAQTSHLQQIIYLSGIANDPNLSKHLQSRLQVEKILADSGVPLTVLRAAMIIGSGSASFQILSDLVEKLPFMVTPKWVHTRNQPIALQDVLFYLQAAILHKPLMGRSFDIGGPEIVSYKDFMLAYAKARGLRRLIVDVPFFSPRLSSYWLYFITSTSFPLAKSLVDSMKNEVVKGDDVIDRLLPHNCLNLEQALRRALRNKQRDTLHASWKDAAVSSNPGGLDPDTVAVPQQGVLRDRRTLPIERPLKEVSDRIWSIGGAKGWYAMDWAWRVRGFVDKLAGGIGLRRGRRHPTDLRVGDAVDFWRVVEATPDRRRLVLFAEVKMPGKAWLSLELEFKGRHAFLCQTATFQPKGISGRAYWYALKPLHSILFQRMARALTGYASGERPGQQRYPKGPRAKSLHKSGLLAQQEA